MVSDLLALVGPLMASPLLYPLLTGLGSLDGVLPMIPSEAAVLAAGVYAHTGAPSLPLVILATALGVFVGDHLAYGLSRSVLGPRLIGRSRRVSRAVAVAGRHLDRRAGLLIVTSRFLPGGRVAMNAACGTARVPLSRFTPAAAIAALAWAAYTAGLGYLGGAAFAQNPLLGLALGLVLSFAFGGVVELIRRRAGRRRAARRRAARRTVRTRALVSAAAAMALIAVPIAAAGAPAESAPQRRVDGRVAVGGSGSVAEVRAERRDVARTQRVDAFLDAAVCG